MNREQLDETFAALRQILHPYAQKLVCTTDRAGELYVDTHHRTKNGKPLFFAAVVARKHYVSYHLMPVYVQPALLESLSPALGARRHGKSCFNFKSPDATLFAELAVLTETGYRYYGEQGYLS